jgi:acyl transferase domain-containing protein/acyl carrier protein
MGSADIPPAPESIAIVGMAGRFPKARNLEEYWRNLRDGVECLSYLPAPDDVADRAYLDRLSDPNFVKAGGALEDMDLFDAPFFGFSARDAEVMDPQQRIFLECAWQSLEDAGYDAGSYPGLIGVFAGAALSFYMSELYTNNEALASLDDFQIAIGNDKDHLTTQVSYRLNLRGPSITVQTACSTSLVAVCMACQSLLNFQCDMALAGGVSADVTTGHGYYYQPGGIFSPDGHCRPFDAAAQGTVAGNGVGIVVLKRLSEAIADRDHIRAVIKGFALNNDGSGKVGYTAPGIGGQAEVIAMAHAMADVEPESITYIEAHGTGTPLGDPIEIAALQQVFGAGTSKHGFCAIGSVKSNIGHLDTAAGVAGLIKAVLALEHRMIPPTLHFTRPNPKIDFAKTAFYVAAECSPWRSTDGARRAGVSSFGIGGTNAHVILEEAGRAEPSRRRRPSCLLSLSARTPAALEAATDNLAAHLAEHPGVDLADVAYTYHVGRKAFEHRRMLVCSPDDVDDARTALERRDPRRVLSGVAGARGRPLFFMFPGQGAQDVDMASEVYRTEPTFRLQVDRCCELLRPQLGLDLRELLYPAPERRQEAALMLGRTVYTQPALFTIEYALARLWMEWGIEPSAMVGHSIGEYVAACLAEVFSLEDALKLVAARGQLMDQMPPGAMLAVPLSEPAARRHLGDGLALAAVNGPSSCVLSGPSETLDQLAARLSTAGTRSHRLRTSHAFHSSMMEPVVDRYVSVVRTVSLHRPRIPFLSSLTGAWITDEAATDPRQWGRQLRRTVRFADGLQQLLKTPDCILLEVGPGHILGDLARQQPDRRAQQLVLSSLSATQNPASDVASLVGTLGKLWLHGAGGNWSGFYAHDQPRRAQLPTYPFERQRYWIGPGEDRELPDDTAEPSARHAVADWFYFPSWKPAVPYEPPRPTGPGERKTRWLVFDNQSELGARLVQRLRQDGHQVVTITPAAAFAPTGAFSYAVRPDEPESYHLLLKNLRAQVERIDTVIHLWSVTSLDGRGAGRLDFEQHQQLGFYSITFLVQALERLRLLDPIELNVITNQTQVVSGDEALCPAKATLIGACKVIPQEHPNIACRIVDLDYDPSGGLDEQGIVEPLLAELTDAPFEPAVGYRRGRRWLPTFEAVRLAEAADGDSRTRQGGVYLITGGLGRIGLVLAAFLARTARAKLVLTGRSPFPEPNEWERWLASDPDSVTGRRIRRLLDLQAAGAEVIYRRADAADREQMRRVIEETETRFGAIHGVIHGAGDTEAFSPVRTVDPAVAGRQFRPKAVGLMVLDELLRGKRLDFCLLLSSISSALGGLGLAAYSAANCYLDAVASERNQKGSVPWISVNWDAWHFPDGDDPGEEEPALADAILPWEGEAALQRILARAPRQVIVSTTDLSARHDQWIRGDGRRTAPGLGAQGATPQHSRPDLATPYVAPRSATEEAVAEIWRQLLGVTPVGVFDNFLELGGHSLLAIQLIARLRQDFQVEVPVQRVFELPTIADLSASIEADRRTTDEDESQTAQVLRLVEQLTERQARALLDQDDNSLQQTPLDI